MSYSVDPRVYRKVFTLPAAAAEKIRFADADALRLLIWAFCDGPEEFDAEAVSKELGCSVNEAEEALMFWAGEGIFTGNTGWSGAASEPAASPVQEIPPAVERPVRRSRVESLTGKPTVVEAAKRGVDPEIAMLLGEIQIKLGRTINAAEMATVVWIHDTLGLPSDVIMMLAEYAVSEGKTGLRYIEKTALSWADEEIFTAEKAEAKLLYATLAKKAWVIVRSAFGIEDRRPSEKELTYSKTWVSDWGFSKAMLRLAYDACVDSTGKLKMSYINKVLASWNAAGITTPAQLKAAEEARAGSKGQESAASFSADDLAALIK